MWELIHSAQTDRQRDVIKLIVAFPNFMNAPTNTVCCCCCCSCCYCHRHCCEEILFKFVTYNLKVYSITMFVVVEVFTVYHT